MGTEGWDQKRGPRPLRFGEQVSPKFRVGRADRGEATERLSRGAVPPNTRWVSSPAGNWGPQLGRAALTGRARLGAVSSAPRLLSPASPEWAPLRPPGVQRGKADTSAGGAALRTTRPAVRALRALRALWGGVGLPPVRTDCRPGGAAPVVRPGPALRALREPGPAEGPGRRSVPRLPSALGGPHPEPCDPSFFQALRPRLRHGHRERK